MNLDRHALPTDVKTLHEIIWQLLDVIEEQRQQIACLTERVQSLERQLYGKRSERGKRAQVSPQNTSEDPQEFKGHGRGRLADTLPRERKDYELSASERVCEGCGGFLSKIGTVGCDQLESTLPQVYVIEHRRAKYACRRCQDKVVVAKMPRQPIDKGLPGPGLLAEVLVNKYQDHLPLYRQSQRYKRFGVSISRSTLGDWVSACADLLAPLVARMKTQALVPSGHVFADDTPIRVLRGPENKVKTGRFWIYTSKGTPGFPACTVYDYTASRQAAGPLRFLKEFEGYLQADAYAGFNKLYQDSAQGTKVTEVGCLAHARRYFYDSALGTSPESWAHTALGFIQDLYKIERQGRKDLLTVDQMKAWRQAQAPPLLKAFHTWLQEHHTRVLPQSLLGKAITYTLNHWQALRRYLEQGFLEIDNNRAERGIRPLAIGRKNYLFVGNDRGGHAAATLYSLLETCKQHHVNPWLYLKDVLNRISTHPYSKIEELLPYHWHPSAELTSASCLVLSDSKIAA